MQPNLFHGSLLALATLGACVYGDIADAGDLASIEAVEQPGGFGSSSGFGRVISSWSSAIAGDARSRFVATSGAGAGHVTFALWRNGERDAPEPLFDGCEDATDCDPSSSTALLGLPTWDGERDCVINAAPDERTLRIQCESSSSIFSRLVIPEAGDFGRAMARIPASSEAGVAIIGAPEAALAAEAGELFKLIDGDPSPKPLTVGDDAALGAGAQLGAALATAPMAGGDVLIAAAAPGASRVVIFRLPNDPADGDLETLACLDGVVVRPPGTPGDRGGSLAAGDTDGDGIPEIFVGSPATNEVRALGGSALGGAAGCGDPGTADDPATTVLGCGAIDAPSVERCGDFGAALATGDVNGDGLGDLIVGAPASASDGKDAAGAVYTIPGGPGGLDPAAGRGLALSEPATGALLGEALTTTPSQLDGAIRDELVVGAPGDGRLYIFWCTGVPGDDAADGRDRCLDP